MKPLFALIAVVLVAAGCRSAIEPAAPLSLSEALEPHQNSVVALAYSLDGTHLASAHQYTGHPGTRASFLVNPPIVKVWDFEQFGDAIAVFQVKHKLGYHLLQFSPDGKALSVVADTALLYWDLEHQTLRRTPFENPDAISADLTLVAHSDDERGISILHTADFAVHQTLDLINTYVVEFSPDGSLIVVRRFTADAPSRLEIWNLETGRLQARPQASEPSTMWAHFSPDGRKMATQNDAYVFVCDTKTGILLAQLGPHSGEIRAITFSPDSQTVAVGSCREKEMKWAGEIDLWDIKSGNKVGSVVDKSTWGITALAFRPDGITLASGDGDGKIKIWTVNDQQVSEQRSANHATGNCTR